MSGHCRVRVRVRVRVRARVRVRVFIELGLPGNVIDVVGLHPAACKGSAFPGPGTGPNPGPNPTLLMLITSLTLTVLQALTLSWHCQLLLFYCF